MTVMTLTLDRWSYARVEPGETADAFIEIGQPQGAGRILADRGHDMIEGRATSHIDLDAFDHIYRTEVAALPDLGETAATLRLAAIGTIATITWNDEVIAASVNAFVPIHVDVSGLITTGGTLEVRCHSLTAHLDAAKWPRPRFKTKLVADQRLRHVRAGLLGRIPSWSPPVPFVGISGPAVIELADVVQVVHHVVRPSLHAGIATLQLHVEVNELGSDALTSATVHCAGTIAVATVGPSTDSATTTAPLRRRTEVRSVMLIENVSPWWPHTHGDPTTYPVRVDLTLASGRVISVALADVGFRRVDVDRDADGNGFGVCVNGVPIFCRGSAWMPLDQTDPWIDRQRLRTALEQCRDSGMNMIRLTGVTGWEQPAFYELCDALGILVWQDLPFATLDQPTDAAFVDHVRREVAHHMEQRAASPSLVVVCGASERQQQAAMLGLDANLVSDAVGAQLIDEYVATHSLNVAVVPCSPSGGHLPFAADVGVSHYYGVGAYQRPLTDARHANVRFTSECLAFANVPDPQTLDRFLLDGETPPTHPRWKERIPRDGGVGWDFDDVRDYYVHLVTGVDPTALRRRDLDRYLELSRFVPATVMAATSHEWRRPTSSCRGAITWFLRDLWRGAGWGLIDSDGEAKAVLHALAEAWAPVSVGLIDEGLNGVDVWVHNDRPFEFQGQLELCRVIGGHPFGSSLTCPVTVGPHSSVRMRADQLAKRFTDPSDAYMFGPSSHDALTARLTVDGRRSDEREVTVSRFVLDTSGGKSFAQGQLKWSAAAVPLSDDQVAVDITSTSLARGVRLEPTSVRTHSNHVDIVPDEQRRFVLTRRGGGPWPAAVHFAAVNARTTLRVPLSFSEPQTQRLETS